MAASGRAREVIQTPCKKPDSNIKHSHIYWYALETMYSYWNGMLIAGVALTILTDTGNNHDNGYILLLTAWRQMA